MYKIDGICYAGNRGGEMRIIDARPLQGGMLLVSFASGEKRLFDTTVIEGHAIAPLRDGAAQDTVRVELGFISWPDGAIDISPEYVYEHSVVYDTIIEGVTA